MGQFLVKSAEEKDLPQILEIQAEAGLSPWTYEGYRNELEKATSVIKVASTPDGRRIIGFIVIGCAVADVGEIYNLGVRGEFRRAGVGRKLLEAAVRAVIKMCGTKVFWLEVRESNLRAVEFYRGNNFEAVGRRKNFYSNPGEDALLMRMEVHGGAVGGGGGAGA